MTRKAKDFTALLSAFRPRDHLIISVRFLFHVYIELFMCMCRHIYVLRHFDYTVCICLCPMVLLIQYGSKLKLEMILCRASQDGSAAETGCLRTQASSVDSKGLQT